MMMRCQFGVAFLMTTYFDTSFISILLLGVPLFGDLIPFLPSAFPIFSSFFLDLPIINEYPSHSLS